MTDTRACEDIADSYLNIETDKHNILSLFAVAFRSMNTNSSTRSRRDPDVIKQKSHTSNSRCELVDAESTLPHKSDEIVQTLKPQQRV